MLSKGYINISHYERSTNLLGPYQRFVIWVHGCCFDCEGCLAENTKHGPGDRVSIEKLGELILEENIEGITISGGEPFLQAESLAALIRHIKEQRDLGVIIYTGFTLDEILKDKEKRNLLTMTDILIDGKYVKELDDGRAYVGSSNQNIHQLSERYRDITEQYYKKSGRRAEIRIEKDRVILIGVPSKEALNVWNDLKRRAGGITDDFGN